MFSYCFSNTMLKVMGTASGVASISRVACPCVMSWTIPASISLATGIEVVPVSVEPLTLTSTTVSTTPVGELGTAVLFWDGERHRPAASEGGHVGFGPRDELESDLLEYLRKEHRRVSLGGQQDILPPAVAL